MYNIAQTDPMRVSSISDWVTKYRENALEYSHDQSMMTLMTPDEALMVVGPPRLTSTAFTSLSSIGTSEDFHIVGFVSALTYTETSQVQPMKAIGSRRHIFAKTNAPVNGNIGRLMILGRNLLRTLYQGADIGVLKDINKVAGSTGENNPWYTNLEDDLFRIPFGMGIIYASPGTLNKENIYVGEYIEACVLTSRQASLQTGQAMIMENVSFVADRVVPGFTGAGIDYGDINPYGDVAGVGSNQ